MASPQQIQKIKQLAKKGESVNTIKEKLEIPKSTVYYHFKKEVGQKQKEQALKNPRKRRNQRRNMRHIRRRWKLLL